MDLSWDWYRVFYHVASEKQISKAADKLCISQPAVSQSIKLLEESLGFSLFIRKPKGVVMTPQGSELFKNIKQAYNQIISAEKKITDFKSLEAGEIKFGASDTLCSHYLLNYLKKYREDNPEVKIHVFNMTSEEIIRSLEVGKIDLGFINLPYSVNSSIDLKKIKTLQDCFICGSEYKKHFKDRVAISEVVKYPLILLEEETNMRNFLENYLSENGVNCKPELELGSIDLLMKFTSANFGVSFVTRNFIDCQLINKDIFIIDVEEIIPERGIGIIKIRDTELTKSVNKFYEMFV